MVKKIKSDAIQSVAQNVIVESKVSVEGEKTEKIEKEEKPDKSLHKSKYDKITDTQSIRSRGLWLSAIAGMTAVGGKSKESEIVQDEFVTQK